MICQTCRDAGNLNQRGLWLREQDRDFEADLVFARADALHADCTVCDCQHDTKRQLTNSNYLIDVEGRPL